MHSKKFRTATSVAAGTLLMLAAGTAWACTPQATIGVLPALGIPGNVVTVEGSSFNPGPVEIRWNGETGDLIAVGSGPSFSVTFEAPEVAPDFYYVVATQKGPGNSVASKATDTFQVKAGSELPGTKSGAAAGSNRASDLWSGFRSSSGRASSLSSEQQSVDARPLPALGVGMLLAGGSALLLACGLATLRRGRSRT